MDFITDLPPLESFDLIYVVVNQLTKMTYFIPSKKIITGEKTTILFLDNIYRYHGLLDDINSDQRP